MLSVLLTACTLPGHQGGPPPRSTQYTYPGRAVNPDTGQLHSPIPQVAERRTAGASSTGSSSQMARRGRASGAWESFAACERDRADYATLLAQRGDRVLTVRCYRAHETGVLQTR